jgi:TonB family protein
MKKTFFFLSLLGHVLGIALLTRVRFTIKIAPAAPVVIAISIQQPEPFPRALTYTSAFSGRRSHGRGPASFSGSGPVGGATTPLPSRPGRSRIGSGGTYLALFPTSARLKLQASPRSAFSLVLPASGLPFAGANASFPETGKWRRTGKYTADFYPGGNYFSENSGPTGSCRSRLPFAVQNKETAAWNQDVLARIERNWIIPTVARAGWTGQVEIILTIDRDGAPLSLTVKRSSSREALDQAALNAMKASLPFPPLPESIDPRPVVFHFVFTYNV